MLRRARRSLRCDVGPLAEGFDAFEPRTLLDGALPMVTLSIADADVEEKNTNMGRFVLTRTGDVTIPLTVKFRVAGEATPGVDYIGLRGQATIPAGRRSIGLPIIPIDDLDAEVDESVRVIIQPDAAYMLDADPRMRNLRVLIRDDDRIALVTLATPDDSAHESLGEADPAGFTIRRTGAIDLPLTVNFVIGGSATPGVDYVAFASTITIPIGKRAAFVTVTPIGDGLFEGRETVRLTLSEPDDGRYRLDLDNAPSMRKVVYIEDRPLATLAVTDPLATTSPEDVAEFTLHRTGPTDKALRVTYLLEGTAESGVDFVALPMKLVIPKGKSSARIVIRGTGNTIAEPYRTVRITLTQTANYNLNFVDVNSFSGYVRIIDDVAPTSM